MIHRLGGRDNILGFGYRWSWSGAFSNLDLAFIMVKDKTKSVTWTGQTKPRNSNNFYKLKHVFDYNYSD